MQEEYTKSAYKLSLESAAFQEGETIPSRYTCDGADINPPLSVSGVDPRAQTLVLIVEDPDSPGGNWVHWLQYGISPSVTDYPEGGKQEGSSAEVLGFSGINSWQKEGYGGPCPGSGKHRYQFKLYSLDKDFDFEMTPDKQTLLNAMKGHILQEVILTGLYERIKN